MPNEEKDCGVTDCPTHTGGVIDLPVIGDGSGVDCDNPSHVKDCDREALLAKLDEIRDAINEKPLPPVIDIEYICDETSDFWQKVTSVTPINLDGTPGTTTETTVATTTSCDDPAPTPPVDYEIKELSPRCYENAAGDMFTLNTYIPFEDGVEQPPVQTWQDEDGAILAAAPTGVTLCATEATNSSISEVEICADGKNAVRKTVLSSDGTEIVTFEDETGVITPTAWAVGLCIPDVVTVDIEYVQNEDTNVWDQVATTITNGVAGTPVITPTTIASDDDEPDFEPVRVCDAGTSTYHVVTHAYADDGTFTVISDIDTGEACTSGAIVKVTQTHPALVTGTGNIPAGFKTVTINNITGNTTVAGGYVLGNGRRDNSISFNATEIDPVRGILPAITAVSTGAANSHQWIGILPIAEV